MPTLRRLTLLALALVASPAATSAFGLVLPPRSVGRLSRRPTLHTVIQAGGVDDEAPSDAGSVEEEAAALEEVR